MLSRIVYAQYLSSSPYFKGKFLDFLFFQAQYPALARSSTHLGAILDQKFDYHRSLPNIRESHALKCEKLDITAWYQNSGAKSVLLFSHLRERAIKFALDTHLIATIFWKATYCELLSLASLLRKKTIKGNGNAQPRGQTIFSVVFAPQ